MTVFSQLPDVGQFWSTIPVAFLTEQLGPYAPDKAAEESSRPVTKQFIRPWDENDFKRLGLTPPAQAEPAEAPAAHGQVLATGGASAQTPPPKQEPGPEPKLKLVK